MALKVADLYVDVHTDTSAIKDELRAAMEGSDLTLPLSSAKTKAGQTGPAEAPGEEGAEAEMGEAVGGALTQALGLGGGSSGMIASIAAAIGISATALTVIVGLVIGALAIIGGLAAIGMKLLQTAIANSQIISELRSFLGSTLGMLFDTALVLIVATIYKYVGQHLESIKALWGELKPHFVGLFNTVKTELLPSLNASLSLFRDKMAPFLSDIMGAIKQWTPLLTSFLNTFVSKLGPAIELILAYITDIIAPQFESLLTAINSFLYPTMNALQHLFEGPIGDLFLAIKNVLVDSIFPFLRDYVFPIVSLLGEILGTIFYIALFPLFLQIQLWLPIITWLIENVIAPAIEGIITFITPLLEAIRDILEVVRDGIMLVAQILDIEAWADAFQRVQQRPDTVVEGMTPAQQSSESFWDWMGLGGGKDYRDKLPSIVSISTSVTGGWSDSGQGQDLWDAVTGGWWD